jgi:hypothetical protein
MYTIYIYFLAIEPIVLFLLRRQIATTIQPKELLLNNISDTLSEPLQLNNSKNVASTISSTSYSNSTKYIQPDPTIDVQKVKGKLLT